MSNVVEVEVNGKNNANLFFGPLGRSVRGRFELTNATRHDPAAAALTNRWSEPIPGQRIGIDVDAGEGFLIEPLHDEQYGATRDRIKKTHKIEPAKQTFPAHVPTWLYWLKRAVDAGLAKVTAGKLPDKIEGAKMDLFIPHHKSATDKLAAAMERQAAAIEKQNEVFSKLLTTLLEDRKRQR
jgi:hypothetical protein